jgi:hypothetical protein
MAADGADAPAPATPAQDGGNNQGGRGRGGRNNNQGGGRGRGQGRGGRGRQSSGGRGIYNPQSGRVTGGGATGVAPTSGVPYGHVPGYLPGSSSLVEELDKRVLIVLRDGRHLVGVSTLLLQRSSYIYILCDFLI